MPRDERKKLVSELFAIIDGRVKEFVFKHDSVRVIQTALKYGTPEQRRAIAKELKGHYKELAESRYAKFLVGKVLAYGDKEIRDLVVPEFYTHVRRAIKHPEAAWILDDIYRGAATPQQKTSLLFEWYGAEFALFKPQLGSASPGPNMASAPSPETAAEKIVDLKTFLIAHPEKRGPIMRSLHELINLLVSKKTTGFTMLHDAMLQYMLNIPAGSGEMPEFLELLKGDEEGDLLKNLAFTPSGSQLVCLALAHGTAKDRKQILRVYKGLMQDLAYHADGHQIILAACEVIDDTVSTSKAIFPELVGQVKDGTEGKSNNSASTGEETLLDMTTNRTARIPLLFLFNPSNSAKQKALLSSSDHALLADLRAIRTTTSKKDPETRRKELLTYLSPHMLQLITLNARDLVSSSFGCLFMSEVLLGSVVQTSEARAPALDAIASLLKSSNSNALSEDILIESPYVGRMLKSLIQGGRYNPKLGLVELIDPPLGFHEKFYDAIKSDLVTWATGPNSFSILALLEAKDFLRGQEMKDILTLERAALEKEAFGGIQKEGHEKQAINKGCKAVLEKL